jgi:hypothetical protein
MSQPTPSTPLKVTRGESATANPLF